MASERETSIDFFADENFITVYTCEKKYIRRIMQLKDQYPKKIKIMYGVEGEYISVKMPKSWFKFPKPKKQVNMSEDQRQAAAERMKKARDKKAESQNA